MSKSSLCVFSGANPSMPELADIPTGLGKDLDGPKRMIVVAEWWRFFLSAVVTRSIN